MTGQRPHRATVSRRCRRTAFVLAAALLAVVSVAEDRPPATNAPTVEALQAEVAALRTLLPDQAHAMSDVGYHAGNLWFAGQQANWPLAQFYLGETKSHLEWAARLKPERKTSAGVKLDLKSLVGALELGPLAKVNEAIAAKDTNQFAIAYRATLAGCYDCHTICEKPYLRPQVPPQPGVPIINPDPASKWPK
ncbi:MAG TPA: hypothetical protein VMB21_08255 [Candidatus Limnocylindria bacterium]|jgi:hypothetical protein|nr:hypothetical protein [Candidatus Limnocylindria bacterium]